MDWLKGRERLKDDATWNGGIKQRKHNRNKASQTKQKGAVIYNGKGKTLKTKCDHLQAGKSMSLSESIFGKLNAYLIEGKVTWLN